MAAQDGITAEEAEKRTNALKEMLPAEWRRDDVLSKDFEGLTTREDCKEVLAELTRGIPMGKLLEDGPSSLHNASDKSQLPPQTSFFLSAATNKLIAFVSHRWTTDPRTTSLAVMMHLKLQPFNAYIYPSACVIMAVLFLLYPPIVIVLYPMINFLWVGWFDLKNPKVLQVERPILWFDKATVHQHEQCLTQAGLHLFDYFLQQSDHFMVLFQPSYLTRVWCVYELAWWLRHKSSRRIRFVPLSSNAHIAAKTLAQWPLQTTFTALIFAFIWPFFAYHGREVRDLHGPETRHHLQLFTLLATGICLEGFSMYTLVTLLLPARRERLAIAKQLGSFDVRNTQAWSQADRQFVLGKIASWWSPPGSDDSEKALDHFNESVRTTVARRLHWMLLRVELTLCAVLTVGWVANLLLTYLLMVIVLGDVEPWAWKDFAEELAVFVSPDECILDYWNDKCNTTNGVGHHRIVKSAACLDGVVVDPPEPDRCWQQWSMDGGLSMFFLWLLWLLYTMVACYKAIRWGRRCASHVERAAGVGLSILCLARPWLLPTGPPACPICGAGCPSCPLYFFSQDHWRGGAIRGHGLLRDEEGPWDGDA